MNSHYQRKSQELASDRAVVEDARKALVKERLELELLRRQMERWCIKFATHLREDFTITEKASTRACSWLKAPTTFKTLLRHYAKWALTPR